MLEFVGIIWTELRMSLGFILLTVPWAHAENKTLLIVYFNGKNEKLLSFMCKQVFHLKQATSTVSWLLIVKEEHLSGKGGCGSPCCFMGRAHAYSFPYGGKFPAAVW